MIAASSAPAAADPLAPKATHYAAKAKSVIFLFMAGGPSQLELFDHKPKLQELDGQVVPPSYIEEQAVRLHQAGRQAARHAAQVRAARPVGGGDQRVPAAPGDDRRRRLHRPQHGDRRLQPRPGEAVRQHRLAAVPAGRAWARGSPTASAASRRTCRASWCCNPARAVRAAARRCGAAASCRRPTRACRSSPGRSRS